MQPTHKMRPWVPLLMVAAGCSQPASGVPDAPIFTRDVAPIVFEHCARCHRPGEQAPFSLLTYRDLEKRHRQVVEVVASGYMPPWLPEPLEQSFEHERRLSASEIETLQRWSASGAPEGDLALLPQTPVWSAGWQLGEPDLVIEMPSPYALAAEGRDEFRNFVLPVPLTGTRFVRALEFRPGKTSAVHHAILAIDRAGECRRRDAQDPEPGFPGMTMASAEPPDGHFLGWTPGRLPYETPEGMAFRLHSGDELVVQVHLTKTGQAEEIAPRIGLYFTETPPTRFPHSVVLYSEEIDIPAGAPAHLVTDEFTLPIGVELVGIYPHAHYLGRRLRGFARRPDGETLELLRIDDWDFNWQEEYRFAHPIELPAGTTLHMEWSFDNTEGNPRNPNRPPVRVTFGERSEDEMATLSFMVLPPDEAGTMALKRARWQRTIEKKPYDWHAYNALGVLMADEGRRDDAIALFQAALELRPEYPEALSNLGLSVLNAGHPEAALELLANALRLDGDLPGANVTLGRALAAVGRTEEALAQLRSFLARRPDLHGTRLALADLLAISGDSVAAIAEYRELLRLRPELPEAHNNLANTLFTTGDLEGAQRHYGRALALRPEYFNAQFNLGRSLMAAGRRSDGVAALRAACRLRPDDELARQELLHAEGSPGN